jgi:hypothetical protein
MRIGSMRLPARQSLKNLMLLAFLGGGLLLVRIGALPFWGWCALTGVTLLARLLTHLDRYQDELLLSDQGLTRQHGSRMRQNLVESLRWEELSKVEVLARETGPAGQDLLFLLHGSGSNGVAVPGPLAQQHDLPALLERRLPGFRTDLLRTAAAATERASFTLWQAATSTAAPAAGPAATSAER